MSAEIVELLGAFLAGALSGGLGWRWWIRRPLPFAQEERDAGLRRYQAWKASRSDGAEK